MAMTANVHEAKTQLSRLIYAALRGEEVIIARNGQPAVTLIPVARSVNPRRPGRLRGEIVEIDPNWWHPDDALARLFHDSDPSPPDPLA